MTKFRQIDRANTNADDRSQEAEAKAAIAEAGAPDFEALRESTDDKYVA